jgi:hypothetical protein
LSALGAFLSGAPPRPGHTATYVTTAGDARRLYGEVTRKRQHYHQHHHHPHHQQQLQQQQQQSPPFVVLFTIVMITIMLPTPRQPSHRSVR